MPKLALLSAMAWIALGCSDDTSSFDAALAHTFPPVFVDVGGEVFDVCQSWTLNNDEPLYVNGIRQTNEGAWHHSNWSYGPETGFPGPDGTWDCKNRGYNLALAVIDGGVLFAQSTQALEEVQSFTEGAVIVIPPRSKITGNIHLLNVSERATENSLTMELDTIPEEEVKTRLRPIGIFNTAIAADPQAESRFNMECDLEATFRNILRVSEMPDFNIYYVLGHYHEAGNYLKLDFLYEDGSARTIVEYKSKPGDVLGVKVDPPMNSEGAIGMNLTCGFNNKTDRVLTWGIGGLEMCAFFGYIDADLSFQGLPANKDLIAMGEDQKGRLLYDAADCDDLIAIPFDD